MKKAIMVLFFLVSCIVYGQEVLYLDDNFGDWSDFELLYSDKSGDGGNSGIDLGAFSAAADEERLYLMFSVGKELNLQDQNDIVLYIDTDNNAATGYSVQGIGAELEYRFGERGGTVRLNGTQNIRWDDIRLISSPTVTSDTFEVSIARDAEVNGQPLFAGGEIKIAMKDASSNGDLLPDSPGGVSFSFENAFENEIPSYDILKGDNADFRVLSYNVERDSFFDTDKKEKYKRIFKAVTPDIIGFQEIYDHSAEETAALVNEFIDPGDGGQWRHAKENPDIICVSRYPILGSYPIQSPINNQGNGAFLIDHPEGEILFIVAHPPCCDNNENRQKEIDAIMAFIREARKPGGVLQIEENTPVIIAGDMNLVGYNRQLATYLTGDIYYENQFGEDFAPDWDGSELEDAKPFATGMPMAFTWYDTGSSFGPGRLDYVIYTGSVLEPVGKFSLFTQALPADTLNKYGLQEMDATAADHVPLVVDFIFKESTGFESEKTPKMGYNLMQNYPNPFNPESVITYSVPEEANVKIKLFDIKGEEVKTLLDENKNAGLHSVKVTTDNLSSGVYIYAMSADKYFNARKLIIMK